MRYHIITMHAHSGPIVSSPRLCVCVCVCFQVILAVAEVTIARVKEQKLFETNGCFERRLQEKVHENKVRFVDALLSRQVNGKADSERIRGRIHNIFIYYSFEFFVSFFGHAAHTWTNEWTDDDDALAK